MRLFIAIELPEDIITELERIQKKLDAPISGQAISGQHHLTLKFLGEIVSPEKVEELLKPIRFKPFELSLSKIGVFPNEDYIKIVWIGITPIEQIIELQKQIEDSLKSLKIRSDHKFHPHITLSRVKSIKDKEQFKKLIKITPRQLKFKVTSFKLIKSELTSRGPVYMELASFQ